MNKLPGGKSVDCPAPLPAGLPHVAYVLLWYPLFIQPFIFREVEGIRQHLPLTVYTLYGKNLRYCSNEMREAADSTYIFGLKSLPRVLLEFLRLLGTKPLCLCKLFKRTLFKRWTSLEVFAENFWAFLAGISLARLFREGGIDMVYAPWPRGTATAAWVAASLADIPFGISARGNNLEPADPDLGTKLDAALFIRTNNAADQARIEAFDRGQACGKTEIVYNSLTMSAPGSAGYNPADALRLLALGRFDVTKGFDVLISACAILRDMGINFSLTLAGGGGTHMGMGHMTSTLIKLRKDLRLENHVHMPGLYSHDDLPDMLRTHDIFVAPCIVHSSGQRDGIPNTLIEAMSYGLPVVVTTINALPEVVRNNETGMAVPQKNPEALADAIAYLAKHPDEARRMGATGRLSVLEMFDPKRNSQRMADIFINRYALWKSSCAE